jgi:beta-lactamase regulating signal transducer with metallopeptidase domain
VRSFLHLAVWLAFVTLVFADVEVALGALGREIRPRLRRLWALSAFAVALLSLLLTPWRLWAAGALALGAILHLGLHVAWQRRLERRLVPAPPSVHRLVADLCARWALVQPDRVAVDPEDRLGPLVMGLGAQVLVLPRSAVDLSTEELTAMLAHELAHVQGRDAREAWAAGLCRLLMGWHPLARRLLRLWALEMELEADWRAVEWLGDVRSYALTLGRWGLRRASLPAAGGAMLSGGASDLVVRLRLLSGQAEPGAHLQLPDWLPERLRSRPAAKEGAPARREVSPAWLPLFAAGYLGLFSLVIHLL